MSLKVWLPFTDNDLANKGSANLHFNNTSSSVIKINNNGKIGKCWERVDTSGNYIYSTEKINLTRTQSMFCWINFTNLQSSCNLTGICGTHRYSTFTGMGITIRYVSSTSGYISCDTGTGSGRTYVDYYGKTLLKAGNWYHVGFTYDGTNIRFYVNGNLDGTTYYPNQKVVEDNVLIYNWSFGGSGTDVANYSSHYKLNDLRMYDHCLSENEIKELSRGLVAQYKFNTNYNRTDILSDNSGNGYNGKIHGTLKYISGSPRSNFCSYMGAYQQPYIDISKIVDNSSLSNCTITYWAKYDDGITLLFTGQSGSYYLMAANNGNFYHANFGTVSVYRDCVKGTYNTDKGKWHFYAIKNVNMSGINKLYLNNYSTTFKYGGGISDLRIYSTELSDEDIKEIYSTPIFINKNKTIMIDGSFNEANSETKFNKNGNIECKEINELGNDCSINKNGIIYCKEFIEK